MRRAAALAALATIAFVHAASGADRAGAFDFYVLALSWSPTYCAVEGDPDEPQCALPGRGLIVHGLWPQHESGYPEYCETDLSAWVADETIDAMRDIMPGGRLVGYQWRKHGLCSGLAEEDYFALVRRAYERLVIPDAFAAPGRDRRAAPADIETAFADANNGLVAEGMSVQCRDGAFSEIRICLTKDLAFRQCEEVDADACRARAIAIRAVD